MKYNFVFKILGLLIILTGLTSCVSIKVQAEYDKSVDFTKYKTLEYHGWAAEFDKILSPADKRLIEESFAQEFKKRGVKVVQSGGDMVATLFIMLQKKHRTSATANPYSGYGGYYGYGPGYGWGPSYSSTTYKTIDLLVGTLVCNLSDPKTKRLIWEGKATKTVEQDHDQNTRDKNIPNAVARLMRYYPVSPVKK